VEKAPSHREERKNFSYRGGKSDHWVSKEKHVFLTAGAKKINFFIFFNINRRLYIKKNKNKKINLKLV
jgi:hypothetical protein